MKLTRTNKSVGNFTSRKSQFPTGFRSKTSQEGGCSQSATRNVIRSVCSEMDGYPATVQPAVAPDGRQGCGDVGP